MPAFVYDTGALIAMQRRDLRMMGYHELAVGEARERPFVPVVVLAQAWRGGPQPLLSRMLQDCEIVPDTERIGRLAGDLCARASTSDVVDAIVMATALALDARIVTSDSKDLAKLALAAGRRVKLFVV